MNGGMDYPPAFRRQRGFAERALLGLGRLSASVLNLLLPGKRRAEMLLVANPRTRDALPPGVCPGCSRSSRTASTCRCGGPTRRARAA
jgi:hypothetical protein